MIQFLISLIDVYTWLIIIRVLLSWLPNPSSEFVIAIHNFLYQVTEPYLGVFRRFIPTFGAIDISPIIAIMVLFAIQRALANALL
ncbi:MAG: YggT family protein [Thermoleophilia bacterium]